MSALLSPLVVRFDGITVLRPTPHSPSVVQRLTVRDEAALSNILREIMQEVDGHTFPRLRPRVARALRKRGYDPKAFGRAPKSAQQERVQLGDLGELMAVLVLAAKLNHGVEDIYPKNLIKIKKRYSERGFDVLVLQLDFNDKSAATLSPNDMLVIVESKASEKTTAPDLSARANLKRGQDSLRKLFFELELLRCKLSSDRRVTHGKCLDRVALLLSDYVDPGGRHTKHLRILSVNACDAKHEDGVHAQIRRLVRTEAIIADFDVNAVRVETFAHRHV